MALDSQGYLWMHNDNDFFKYNGHQVEYAELNSIVGSRKHDFKMYNDICFKHDSIYFHNNEYLSLLHPSSQVVRNVWKLPQDYFVSFIYQDGLKNLWIFTASKVKSNRPVFKSEDGIHFNQVFDLNDVIGSRGIFWDFFELDDKDGNLYIQWRLGDLLILDQNGKEIQLKLNDQKEFEKTRSCSQFRLDNKKRLWRIYKKEFEIYDPEKQSFVRHPLSGQIEFLTECKKQEGLSDLGSYLNLRFLFTDSKDRIWIGCAASFLLCFEPETKKIKNLRAKLVDELGAGDIDIKAMLEDSDGNLFVNQGGGLVKLKDKVSYFDTYLQNTNDKNHPIYQDKENQTLQKIFAHYNEYAYRDALVHSIEEDPNGNIIFQSGVFTYQLNQISNEVKLVPLFCPKEPVFLSYKKGAKLFAAWDAYYKIEDDYSLVKLNEPILKVEQCLVQKNGDVWVSGLLNANNYLFSKLQSNLEFDNNYVDQYGNNNLSINKVNGMSEDSHGNLWLGTHVGLMFLDLEKDSITNIESNLKLKQRPIEIGTSIEKVYCTGNDKVWFLSKYEIGLYNHQKNELERHLVLNENIAGSQVDFISMGDSVIWMGHNLGLSYHNFNSNKTINISSDKGLDLSTGIQELKLLTNNKIAVGTGNGLYLFHPDSLLQKIDVIEELEKKYPIDLISYSYIDGKNNQEISSELDRVNNTEIVLNHNDKMLELNFTLLNFSYPKGHAYSYKLEGHQDKWSSPTNENSVQFTSLPPGDYEFKVRASGPSGIWSEDEISLSILVEQAWFRTWWFILGSIILIGVLIYFFTRYYYRQKIERRKAMEKLRNKISSDLHDDVGTLLAGLSMKSELMALKHSDNEKNKLLGIAATSRNAMSKMRDIVWAIDSTRDKYQNLISRMQDFASSQLEDTNFKYDMVLKNIDELGFIEPDIRQNLYLIFKESLTNAIKHSNGDQISVLIEKRKNKTIFSIKDNGRVNNKYGQEGLGMKNMLKRAEKINANLKIVQEGGFEVKVEITTA